MMIHTKPVNLRTAWHRLVAQQIDGMRLNPEQMKRFNAGSAPDRFRHFLLTGLGSLALFNLFLISDWYMVPDVFDLALVVRLYVLTPLVLALVITGFVVHDWWLANLPPWVAEALSMAGTMAVAASLGVLMMATQSEQLSIYRAGLVPILVFGNLVQRLRFRYALISTLFSLMVCVGTMVLRQDLSRPYAIVEVPLALLMALVAIYTLVSNFNLEMDERQRFLQTERAHALRTELEQSHLSLGDLSNRDPLTGLANRRRFDSYLNEAVQTMPATASALALMLIDVDHFKAFNDRYGHPAGDQCLRLIAQALTGALPPGPCLLARWGGEEFALVMPDTDPVGAMKVAEALRVAVTALRMRHEASLTSDHVSISAGLAMLDRVDDADVSHAIKRLLKQADHALYQSKQDGRNRCTMAG